MLSEVPEVETISRAKDQPEVQDLLTKLNHEILVLDIQIPGGSGMDLLRKIKKGGEKSKENNAPDNR